MKTVPVSYGKLEKHTNKKIKMSNSTITQVTLLALWVSSLYCLPPHHRCFLKQKTKL